MSVSRRDNANIGKKYTSQDLLLHFRTLVLLYCIKSNYYEKVFRYGTGSYPLPPQGWHRRIRRIARYKPLKGPCLRSASTAYWLQVGVNLHAGGVKGEMQV